VSDHTSSTNQHKHEPDDVNRSRERVSSPGDAAGVPVPSEHALGGTSEQTAVAAPGKPDGEVDTRR
jgi:hypothetical protein